MELVGRIDCAGFFQQVQRCHLRGARRIDHGLVLGCVLVWFEQDPEELLAYGGRAGSCAQLGRPGSNLLQQRLLFFDGGQGLLHDLGRRLAKPALASTPEIMRRLEQPKKRAGLLLQRGLVIEIVARQVGKAEFFFGRELPGQLQLDGGGNLLRRADQLCRFRLVELEQEIGGLDLDPLAAGQFDLRGRFGFGQHTASLEFAGFFKQCIHGRDCPMCSRRSLRARPANHARWLG